MTTGSLVRTGPRQLHGTGVACLVCGGPLVRVRVRLATSMTAPAQRDAPGGVSALRPVETWTHARHRDWASAPHQAVAVGTTPGQQHPEAWTQMGWLSD